MIEEIAKCKKCNLYKNQLPLLDRQKETCDVMWVGLSAKQIKDPNYSFPLAPDTNSGKLVYEIEEMLPKVSFYKTNIVKCVPLNKSAKIRYPKREEIFVCIPNLIKEIEIMRPKVIFLLGGLVTKSFNSYVKNNKQYNYLLDDYNIVSIKHPSYIAIYKRKFKNVYKDEVCSLIKTNVA